MTVSVNDKIICFYTFFPHLSFFFRAFQWSAPIAQTLFQYTFPFVIYPLNNISFCASIFTTVAMAYERHTAVCKPIHYRNVTAKYSVKRRTAW